MLVCILSTGIETGTNIHEKHMRNWYDFYLLWLQCCLRSSKAVVEGATQKKTACGLQYHGGSGHLVQWLFHDIVGSQEVFEIKHNQSHWWKGSPPNSPCASNIVIGKEPLCEYNAQHIVVRNYKTHLAQNCRIASLRSLSGLGPTPEILALYSTKREDTSDNPRIYNSLYIGKAEIANSTPGETQAPESRM